MDQMVMPRDRYCPINIICDTEGVICFGNDAKVADCLDGFIAWYEDLLVQKIFFGIFLLQIVG